jgi:hypothetical protein
MRASCSILLLVCWASAGCSGARVARPAPSGSTTAAAAISLDVPFHAQAENLCGPAALAMLLAWSGVDVPPELLAEEVYVPGRAGTMQHDLVAATRRRDRIAYAIRGRDELVTEISSGHPVLVLQNLGLGWLPRWHYAVVVGRNPAARTWTLHTAGHRAREVDETVFWRTWERAGGWGLLVLAPHELPAGAEETRFLEAAVGLEEAGRVQAARSAYSAAITRWPDNLVARIGLANAAYALGDHGNAESVLREAVARHPDSAVAWNNFAHALAVRGKKAEGTIAAQRAVDIGGRDVEVYRRTLEDIETRSGATRPHTVTEGASVSATLPSP